MKKIVVFWSDGEPVVVRKVFEVIPGAIFCLACIIGSAVGLSHVGSIQGIDGYGLVGWPGLG